MLTRLPSSSERPWSTGASNLPMNLTKPARFAISILVQEQRAILGGESWWVGWCARLDRTDSAARRPGRCLPLGHETGP